MEGKEWVRTARPKPARSSSSQQQQQQQRSGAPSHKEQNEAYFARLGALNDSRPADLPPSQGGKYAGFGSTPTAPDPASGSNGGTGLDDIARDPVAALTKGWGFFANQATRAAQLATEQVLKPTAQKLGDAELTRTLSEGVSSVGKMGYEGLSRFVEGPSATAAAAAARRPAGPGPDPEHKGFWESFGEPVAAALPPPKPSALGTSAMKKPVAAAGGGTGGSSNSNITSSNNSSGGGGSHAAGAGGGGGGGGAANKKDDWDNDDWDKF